MDGNLSLLQVNAGVFIKLANKLRQNKAWLQVAKFALDHGELSALSASREPSETLLVELGNRLWQIRHLRSVLRDCDLLEALAIISDREPLVVEKSLEQSLNGRDSLKVKIGDEFKLRFDVKGLPPPAYKWFRDNEVIKGQHRNVLLIKNFRETMEGEYTCVATQYMNEEKMQEISSSTICVQVHPEAPVIIEKPLSDMSVLEGSNITLTVKATGYPTPTFQWTHKNNVLNHANKAVLELDHLSKASCGLYKCYIRNKAGEATVQTNIFVHRELKTFEENVSAKIALLIANEKYDNLDDLHSPSNDVRTLATILEGLGFKTLRFLNLNLQEMNVVLKLLSEMICKGCYVIFYFAGHGFECLDYKYLLPTDSPDGETYSTKDALPEYTIWQLLSENEPRLCLIILDMCLKIPYRDVRNLDTTSDQTIFKSDRNLIRAYSTASNRSAYERENQSQTSKQYQSNGIYVEALKKYLGQKMTVMDILQKVNEEVLKECPDQIPTVSFATAVQFYLDSPVEGSNIINVNYPNFFATKTEFIPKAMLQKYMETSRSVH